MSKKTFTGGVHPPDGKALAREVPFRDCPAGPELIFPLSQHIGKPAKAIVKKGDKVLAGQILAEADGFVSAHVISSCSGTVKALENRPDVNGVPVPAIVVENDGKFTLAEGVGKAVQKGKNIPKNVILERVKAAGIVGMGGAGFPTHVKLSPKDPDAIEYVLANGAECEPYITCDDQLMRTKASEIVEGMELLLKLFPNAQGFIIIEENKPEAIQAMTAACAGKNRLAVYPVETKYPQGGERSIISAVTGRHLQAGMLPADVGCLVENVGTLRAICRAVCYNEPLMERGFTVSGEGVKNPCNLIVKIGTPYSAVLAAAGGFAPGKTPEKILSGGPMMGFSMPGLDAAVCKNNNALTVLPEDPVAIALDQMTECLRCGRCNQVCPLGLTPQMMAAAARKKDYERYEKKLYGMECIACSSCTYICPAKRPLMQLFKQTKSEILQQKRKGGQK